MDVILGWRETKPGWVHCEAELAALNKLGVVLHHALQTEGALEASSFGISVLRVDEFGDHAFRGLEALDVGLKLENERVCIAWEGAVPILTCHVTIWVPFLFQDRVQLVVLNIDDYRVIITLEVADGTHCLSRHPRNAA